MPDYLSRYLHENWLLGRLDAVLMGINFPTMWNGVTFLAGNTSIIPAFALSAGITFLLGSVCTTLNKKIMLRWTVIFLIIAIIAAIFGFGGVAAGAASIAKVIFFLFLVLFVISLLSGSFRNR